MNEIVSIRVPRIQATVVRPQDRGGHVLQHELHVGASPLGYMMNCVWVKEDRSRRRRQVEDERHRFRQCSHNLDLSPANDRAQCSLSVRPPITHVGTFGHGAESLPY
jgi:hypothetical protein